MRNTSIALLALLLVAAPIIGSVGAQQSSASDSGLTLDELEQNGPRQANSPDGVRMGQERAYWAVYYPAGSPFADPGNPEGGENLAPDHTVGRNSIYLRTWTFEDRQHTVHVAYWQRGTRTVTEGNTTREEPVARNVTHVTHEVTFERGRPTVEIPLQRHDDPTQVTIWIEGEDYARWTFEHQSIATTQSSSIDSQGDYLLSVITDFLLWIVVGGFVVGWAIKRALDRAGIGPQYGYTPWVIALGLATGLGGLLLFESLANLLVNAQYLLALFVVGIIGIVMLETYTTNVSSALFLRPTLDHAESPTGDDAFDVLDAEAREERIIRTPDGEISVVKPGLLAFLARVFGSRATLDNAADLRTRVPMNGGWDELFLVDPEADEILHYSPESWEVTLPELTRANAGEYGAAIAGLALSAWTLSSGFITGTTMTVLVCAATAAGLAVWTLDPVDGVAAVNPAPVHLRTAFGTMVKYAEDVDDAKHFDELKEQLDGERISKQREVDREVERHDRTLAEGMLDQNEAIPRGTGEDTDDEVTDKRRDADGPLGNGEVADDD